MDAIELIRFNKNTITDKTKLLDELKQVKQQGVAYDHAEQIEGCHCIAAPVINQYGYPIAAIWVTGPSSRIPTSDFHELGLKVKQAADAVSQQLSNGTHYHVDYDKIIYHVDRTHGFGYRLSVCRGWAGASGLPFPLHQAGT